MNLRKERKVKNVVRNGMVTVYTKTNLLLPGATDDGDDGLEYSLALFF